MTSYYDATTSPGDYMVTIGRYYQYTTSIHVSRPRGFGTGARRPIDCRRVFGGTRGRSLAMAAQIFETVIEVIHMVLVA